MEGMCPAGERMVSHQDEARGKTGWLKRRTVNAAPSHFADW
jgi:hypothetical protein